MSKNADFGLFSIFFIAWYGKLEMGFIYMYVLVCRHLVSINASEGAKMVEYWEPCDVF